MDTQSWKQYLPEFKEKTEQFYNGTLSKGEYKGFSGLYGSYAQKGGQASMLRLRMTAGCVTKEKMQFVADAVRKYGVKRMHFTTCEAIQLHDLTKEQVYPIMEEALDAGIVTMGGGGDYPRNVMCSPLSGVEEEYFDVMPYAQKAGEYLMDFILAEKMPRKLKVCFSNSPANLPHATFRDLGFAATADGKFDVYSAGGLGNNPRMGVKVAEGIEPEMILYYIKAMWLTFRAYGNYENRGKARTRYMQEALGGPEKYKEAYLEKLQEVLDGPEDLRCKVEPYVITKTGTSRSENPETATLETIDSSYVKAQKQPGLYTVLWHPIGGQPDVEVFCRLSDALNSMDEVQMRLAPDESAYIVNLTAKEAQLVLDIIAEDQAKTLFETSVSCIGAVTCQVGIRDSQGLLNACVKAVREAGIPDGALPQIHISGCPSSCGTHQIGAIGFRGASKKVEGKMQSAYMLYVNGNEKQGEEVLGEELGAITEIDIPAFLVKLGNAVTAGGMDFETWYAQNPDGIKKIAEEYLA